MRNCIPTNTRLNDEEIENLNIPITSKNVESLNKKPPTEVPDQIASLVNYIY